MPEVDWLKNKTQNQLSSRGDLRSLSGMSNQPDSQIKNSNSSDANVLYQLLEIEKKRERERRSDAPSRSRNQFLNEEELLNRRSYNT